MNVLINMRIAKRCLATVLLLLLVGSTTGCFDQVVEPEYDGPPKVQFDPTSGSIVDDGGVVPLNIQLIAPHQSSDTQFPVAVVDTGDIATTLSSDGYEVLTETATIPADSSFGEVRVRVDSAGIPPGETRLLTLALEESQNGDIVPATNFQFFQLTVVGRAAEVGPSPASLAFGEVESGSTAQDTFDVVNDGNAPSEVTNLAVTGADSDAFSIESPSGNSFTLPDGASQEVIVEFTPDPLLTDTTEYEGSVEYNFTNGAGADEASAELTGTGVPPGS